MNLKNFTTGSKLFDNVIGFILLTSLWTWGFEPFILWSVDSINNVINVFHKNYIDQIYSKAMYVQADYFDIKLLAFSHMFLVIAGLAVIQLLLMQIDGLKSVNNDGSNKKNRIYSISKRIIWLAFWAFAFNTAIRAASDLEAGIVSMKTYHLLEIVRPKMTEEMYLATKSILLQIRTKAEHDEIIELIQDFKHKTEMQQESETIIDPNVP